MSDGTGIQNFTLILFDSAGSLILVLKAHRDMECHLAAVSDRDQSNRNRLPFARERKKTVEDFVLAADKTMPDDYSRVWLVQDRV